MDWLRIFGISSLVINLISVLPYFRDIVRGKTHPERASWFLWLVLGGIFFSASVAEGAEESLWFTGMQVFTPTVVFILSIKRGVGGFERRDKQGLAVAAFGLLLWYLTDNPGLAILMALLVDSAGLWLTALKTWEKPESETFISWAALLLVGTLAILSVGEFDVTLLAFPAYVTFAGITISSIMLIRSDKSVKELIRRSF